MAASSLKGKAKANGVPPGAGAGVVPESYTFPPVEHAPAAHHRAPEPLPARRALSPTESEQRETPRSFPGSQTGSPALSPYDVGGGAGEGSGESESSEVSFSSSSSSSQSLNGLSAP